MCAPAGLQLGIACADQPGVHHITHVYPQTPARVRQGYAVCFDTSQSIPTALKEGSNFPSRKYFSATAVSVLRSEHFFKTLLQSRYEEAS